MPTLPAVGSVESFSHQRQQHNNEEKTRDKLKGVLDRFVGTVSFKLWNPSIYKLRFLYRYDVYSTYNSRGSK